MFISLVLILNELFLVAVNSVMDFVELMFQNTNFYLMNFYLIYQLTLLDLD